MKRSAFFKLVPVCALCLSGCTTAAFKPGTYETYVEAIGSANELSRLTTLMALEPQQIAFMSLDEQDFEEPVKDLVVKPGCRCACMLVNMLSYPRLIPVCIDARAGYTYIVSYALGFNSNIWVNEWESASLPVEVSIFDLVDFVDRKSAMFHYKFKADGRFLPTSRSPELRFCAVLPQNCHELLPQME